MEKKLSESALAAKMIREELKKEFPEIKFEVVNDNYSLGSSIDILWNDGPERDQIYDIVNKYKMGHFGNRTDSYEYSNRRKDLPQVTCIFVHREITS
jgi:hypothetical protein